MLNKKFTALLLSATVCISMVACGRENNVEESKSSESAVLSESVVSDDEVSEELTYPLNTTDKLTIWDRNEIGLSDAYLDYTESPFHTGLAEMTGVDVEWQFPTKGADAAQAYNLLLTEEVLPDIIFNIYTSSELEQLVNDGVIYDLTEYVQEYAPDYWAKINEDEYKSVKLQTLTSDGRVVCFASFREGEGNITYQGPVVRKDWLDECGLDVPVTLADWEKMLETFAEKYDAKFAQVSGNFTWGAGFNSGVGAYGHVSPAYYVDDNGTVQFAQAQPEWKEYMTQLNKWYENGWFDADTLTMDATAFRTKAINNDVGASFVPLSQLTMLTEDAELENTGAEWIPVSYPRTASGEPTCMIQYGNLWAGRAAVITKSCPEEKLITALKWLNYGYTEEGNMYWNYGKEGITYTLNSNGEVEFTDLIKNDPMGIDAAVRKYVGTAGAGIAVQNTDLVLMKNSAQAAAAVETWVENTDAAKYFFPSVSYTEDEATIFADKSSQVNAYMMEMALKFLKGDESLDNYDDYLKNLDKMGLQDILKVQQDAYERYIAK